MSHKGEILVVDDNLASLKLISQTLTNAGYFVRPAISGKLAIESAFARLPELILLDIRMEGLSGFEVLHMMKQSKDLDEIPVIFLSGIAESDIRVEGLRLGAVDFITKPFQEEELLARIAVHIELRRLYEQLRLQKIQLEEANLNLRRENEERKKTEAALHELNDQLEDRVIKRTADLESASKEINSLVYTISHELKIPLRAVISFAQILQEEYITSIDAEGNRLIRVIIDNSLKLASQLDQILELLRAYKNRPVFSRVDMGGMVEDVYQTIALPEQLEKVTFNLHPLSDAWADPELMRSVWINLISNALKFSHNNPQPIIEIHSKISNERIIYTIQDNGIGFNPKYEAKLFGPFEQLHKVGEFEGQGIGLAITKRIIERHSGSIWAESEPGKGAAFHFSIPLKKDES